MIRAAIRETSLRPSFQAALLAVATVALAAVPAIAQTSSQSTPSAPVSRNAAAAAPESPYHGAVVEDIIARVNDQVISSSDYQRALQELEAQSQQRNISPADLDEQKRQLLRDLIDNQLLLSRGKQLGITGEAETVRQLDELRKQNNLDSMEALEKAAEQQGVSFADFKASIQNRMITSQVIRDEVGRRINITTADEQQYYDQHPDEFTTPESVKLSEILVPTADPDNAAEVATAQSKADGLEAQLKSGKAFEDVAKASSGNSTAAQGGLLGDYKRGQLAKVLEDATFSLSANQYTAPIRTKQGFVILKVDSHTASALQPFAQVRPQVEDALGQQKMNPALRQYLTRLREEAFVSIKPGYVDVGSSNNEFRPIFSAYTPPAPKKKKKPVGRTRFSANGRGRTRNSVVAAQASAKDAKDAGVTPAAGVPSLADAPGGGTNTTASNSSTSTAQSAATAPAQPTIAKAQKPGKREKVRFGQAPQETLPAADTRSQDAGASTNNGNTSNVETAAVQSQNGTGGTPGNIRYENGEAATDQQADVKKVKTRYAQQGAKVKAAKIAKKRDAKLDLYPAVPADQQEISDKKTQAQPLGLAGDTSKKVPKPKPTEKTRFSDEAGKPKPTAASANGTDVNAPSQTPAAQTQPYKEPSPEAPPNSNAPVQTQTTPTGTGDPLGAPTPAPAQQPPQR